MSNFLTKLSKYKLSFSMNQYRFDKASNFISYEQWVEEKVKLYADSLINQPLLNSIFERSDKSISIKEMNKLAEENVYDSVKIKTNDNKHWNVSPTGFIDWMEINDFSESNIVEMKLSRRGWL